MRRVICIAVFLVACTESNELVDSGADADGMRDSDVSDRGSPLVDAASLIPDAASLIPDAAKQIPDAAMGSDAMVPTPDVGVCLPCFSNYDCAEDRRCLGGDDGVSCCVPGARGARQIGEACGDQPQQNCASSVCVESDDAALCSDRCDDVSDCPISMRRCLQLEGDGWCFPTGGCQAPRAGDLIINEILIDGLENGDPDEFVELINISRNDLDLTGVLLRSNRGERMSDRVEFTGGCIASGGAVAIYADEARWLWVPAPLIQPEFDLSRFGFSNMSDFRFELTHDDQPISRAFGSKDLIVEGTSVNRSPDASPDGQFQLHTDGSNRPSSPAVCPNGLHYEDGCR